MKKFKILVVFLLVITITVNLLTGIVAVATSNKKKIVSKCTDELLYLIENEYKNGNKKIPVYIWYEDIDQDEVDLLTKEETGLTLADCEVIEEFPLPELFEDLDENSNKVEKEIEKYLKKTKKVREKEQKLTDKYTSVHRKFANDKYKEKSTEIIKRNCL